ncbi:MAG: T9SS type A sorting domain-containing protein, partial [Bacteroidota bacterium]|nr:T9SS type A sorting domain-containing protein [Bacteroidota bacterium]
TAGRMVIDAWPDPATTRLTIAVQSAVADQVTLQLCNVLGRMLREHSLQITPGVRTVDIEVGDLPRGMYLLACRSARATVLRKLMLQ